MTTAPRSAANGLSKREKAGDLAVQAPAKYINVKTGMAVSLNVPATLLARADKVVE